MLELHYMVQLLTLTEYLGAVSGHSYIKHVFSHPNYLVSKSIHRVTVTVRCFVNVSCMQCFFLHSLVNGFFFGSLGYDH
jgi:hypothetical protein